MTAAELIEALKKVPPDYVVVTDVEGLSVQRVTDIGELILDRSGEG